MIRTLAAILVVITGGIASADHIISPADTKKYDPKQHYTLEEFKPIVRAEPISRVPAILSGKPMNSTGGEVLPRERDKYGKEIGLIKVTDKVQEWAIPVTVGDKEYTTVLLYFSVDVQIRRVDKFGKESLNKVGYFACYKVEPGERKK